MLPARSKIKPVYFFKGNNNGLHQLSVKVIAISFFVCAFI